MSENLRQLRSDGISPGLGEDAELETRVATNIEQQQANMERQSRLLTEIEKEIGYPIRTAEASDFSLRTAVEAGDISILSPFRTPADALPGRTPTRGGTKSNQLSLEASASVASAQRQVLWKREVDTQKRVIVELRDKIAELQRAKMASEQTELKVAVFPFVPHEHCEESITCFRELLPGYVVGSSVGVQRGRAVQNSSGIPCSL
jgi:hypothetical protein